MKCPHCGKMHPDDFKVCPYTAKPIEVQYQYCNNEDCDFRNPLPLSAVFCPNCGKPLNSYTIKNTTNYTPFCCLIKTKDERYKIQLKTGEFLSDFEFFIVSSRKSYSNSTFHQLLLFEPHNNQLYYLDAKGVLIKIGEYGDKDGFREGKYYWGNKWRYDAEILSDDHILYRNANTYSLYKIESGDKLILRTCFPSRLHNLCRNTTLIGNYICTDNASIRISDGCYETILGYKRCRCLGYYNDNPIFAASIDTDWSNDKMESGCDIVWLTGQVIWHCNHYSIYEFNDSYLTVLNKDDEQGLLDLRTGDVVIPVDEYTINLTPFKDIIQLTGPELMYQSGAYSIKNKKIYIGYRQQGNYYTLCEPAGSGYCFYFLNSQDEVLSQFQTNDIDFDDSLLRTHSYQYCPLICHNNEIINIVSSTGIYHYDEDSGDEFIGASSHTLRFAVKKYSGIEIIDFDGNILYRVTAEDKLYSVSMCSNGYILLYYPRKSILKYYDTVFNEHLLTLPKLSFNKLDELYSGDMLEDNIITLHNGGRDICVILTTSGEVVYDYCPLEYFAPGLFRSYNFVVNIEKLIIIKNCTELIL